VLSPHVFLFYAIQPDEASALLHYYFGAANGDAFSRAALGYRHTFGLGVPKSCWTAVSYYQPVADAVVQEAVEASKTQGPLGSSSGHGLPQIERIRLNVHANQGIKPDKQVRVLLGGRVEPNPGQGVHA
jgi:SEL1 protein